MKIKKIIKIKNNVMNSKNNCRKKSIQFLNPNY